MAVDSTWLCRNLEREREEKVEQFGQHIVCTLSVDNRSEKRNAGSSGKRQIEHWGTRKRTSVLAPGKRMTDDRVPLKFQAAIVIRRKSGEEEKRRMKRSPLEGGFNLIKLASTMVCQQNELVHYTHTTFAQWKPTGTTQTSAFRCGLKNKRLYRGSPVLPNGNLMALHAELALSNKSVRAIIWIEFFSFILSILPTARRRNVFTLKRAHLSRPKEAKVKGNHFKTSKRFKSDNSTNCKIFIAARIVCHYFD